MSTDAVVHVIDDDDAARDSLAFLLRSSQIAVQTRESAIAFLEALPEVKNGCIITDVRMPELDGIELLRRLKKIDVDLPVIIITGHADVPLAVAAMKYGAIDFFEKPFDDDALLAAVHSALDEKEQTSQRDAEKKELVERLAALTGREREVLDALVMGHANKVIAFDLKISPRTVEIYRANVMTKMKAKSLSALVRMALLADVSGAKR